MKRFGMLFFIVIVTLFKFTPANAGGHQLFGQVLMANVEDGKVDYPAIKADSRFQDYLDYLAHTNPDFFASRDEKLAFWINAYNALAIKGILDGKSPAGYFSRINFFTSNHDLAGRKIDLYDLERKILIPFGEPRIHFAIVCASTSCPKMVNEAYTASDLDRQLDMNTRAFINNKMKNRFDQSTKSGRISKIFDWFPKDFEAHSETVQQYLGKYVDDPVVAASLLQNEYMLWFHDYNWTLNGINPA